MQSQGQLIPKVERHKTAIVRRDLSRPVKLAFDAGLFERAATFFDYGCGYGTDVKIVAARGFVSNGWDPYYFSNNSIQPADIVNIGYVINVIEFETERSNALIEAWSLAQRVLLVAARVDVREVGKGYIAWNDGYITSKNTFQKFYEQKELKNYIDQVLSVDAVPAGPGVCFVFRDEIDAHDMRLRAAHFSKHKLRCPSK
jgi:DNA phosphorothioation-associated putative methyltransferase